MSVFTALNEERILGRFLEYVQIDSESGNEKEFAERLVKDLTAFGATVVIDDSMSKTGCNTGNVIAKIKGTTNQKPILLSSHMDTVSPGNGIRPIVKDGIVRSSGDTILGGDDKAGVNGIISALEILKETGEPHGDIEIAFTTIEEGGMFGAKNLDMSQFKSEFAFVFDSGEPGEIIIKAPSQSKINVTIKGKAAHAGVNPESGISAIQVAARAINNMKLLRIDEETTANIGAIAGGASTNIVCPEVKLKGEIRSHNPKKLEEQTAHMKACFEEAVAFYGADCDLTVEDSYYAYSLDENSPLVQYAESVIAGLGLPVQKKPTGGGSDANILNAKGLPTVNLGIGMKSVHSTNEYIEVAHLIQTTKLVLGLILNAPK